MAHQCWQFRLIERLKNWLSAQLEGRIVIADAVVGEIQHDFTAVKGPIWAMQLGKAAQTLYFAGLDDWITKINLSDFIAPSLG